ncbi:Bug family tripartite tricarboxylate transporter substrate binding protein [Parapusillimonas granuli]|uniref:Tripartite tricarboxylate transporter substrate binding protein n=1 Tax=Parapusillimonas granuli TaxID=380911 RepID=A0A853G3Y2_9BURK|nr:tripartite tricarboxylate transporter substrate binding protein [Parapusillimonas granuli]MBB5215613.1 tripartite-type tricarboxylate transporter receptor subunit TctC [Parapusillimonas granuli]MEB2401009.1 tripartite tricarboxylate transporter substrate binding protein [Alcaligenaceae bacterium]NYT49720.1 tripartite tricarboxylate transporter substrate binding protein [Parapusillimonas granuli]
MLKKIVTGLAAAALCAAASLAHAAYPEKPIRLIIPFAPGGSTDILGRVLAEAMQPMLGQPIIVENKAGAGGNIGGHFVAQATPDGYTLLLAAAGPTVINPSLNKNMPFSPVTDLAPITAITAEHNLMAINPSIPAKNLREFIAYAKQHKGGISFGSPGAGTPAHLAGELLNKMAGLDMQHVPYKGSGPAVTDLVAGHIGLMIDNMPPLLPQVQSGRLRAIAVPSAARTAAMPGVPTFEEEGLKGYVIMAWKGLMAPAGTPQPVIDKLHAAIVEVLKRPDIQKRLIELGAEPKGNTPAEFAEQIRSETEWWAKLIKDTNTTVN